MALHCYALAGRFDRVKRPRQLVVTLAQAEMAAVDEVTANARVAIRLVRATRSAIVRRAIVLGLPLVAMELKERG